jgi:hypothetical protein
MTAWQLRDYTIKAGELERFLEAWRNGVPPLRARFGFEVQAWVVPDESRLVQPDPGQWVESKRHFMVRPVAPAGVDELTERGAPTG